MKDQRRLPELALQPKIRAVPAFEKSRGDVDVSNGSSVLDLETQCTLLQTR